ncbi:MAG: hypothetical protein VYE22_06010 [Myxococcota bacterium]|nr:hypothetical protein [Myxococcota bacterium]
MRRAPLAIAALALASCSHGAVLELSLELPDRGDARFAVLDAAPGAPPDGAGPTVAFAPGDEAHVSLVAGADLEAPLHVRVRFCEAPDCAGEPSPPTVRARIERAFYPGVKTSLTLAVPPPPATLEIDACRVQGCIEGRGAALYCVDGTHVCEL